MQMLVPSWNTDQTYPETAYYPHMKLYMNPSEYTMHIHDDRCGIENHSSTYTQQDNAEANNASVL